MYTPDEVFTKLGELAPNEIARLFRDLGIHGRRADSGACPVARYVRQGTGRGVHVGCTGWCSDDTTGQTPRSVAQFISLFDDECYPDLVQPASAPWL